MKPDPSKMMVLCADLFLQHPDRGDDEYLAEMIREWHAIAEGEME
jgi:hypothetical protein